jgi:hypothetical protein
MKKLMTTALIISALSLFADVKPSAPVPCDCTGVGMPQSTTQKITNNSVLPSGAKLHPISLGQYLLYKAELGWLLFLTY